MPYPAPSTQQHTQSQGFIPHPSGRGYYYPNGHNNHSGHGWQSGNYFSPYHPRGISPGSAFSARPNRMWTPMARSFPREFHPAKPNGPTRSYASVATEDPPSASPISSSPDRLIGVEIKPGVRNVPSEKHAIVAQVAPVKPVAQMAPIKRWKLFREIPTFLFHSYDWLTELRAEGKKFPHLEQDMKSWKETMTVSCEESVGEIDLKTVQSSTLWLHYFVPLLNKIKLKMTSVDMTESDKVSLWNLVEEAITNRLDMVRKHDNRYHFATLSAPVDTTTSNQRPQVLVGQWGAILHSLCQLIEVISGALFVPSEMIGSCVGAFITFYLHVEELLATWSFPNTGQAVVRPVPGIMDEEVDEEDGLCSHAGAGDVADVADATIPRYLLIE